MDPEQTIRHDFSHPGLPDRRPTDPSRRVLGWPLEGRELTLAADRATVGRHPQSDLVIAQVGRSGRHAEIVRMASECLTDLKSVNGASGNNRKLGRAVLTHGDVFQIGSCVFRFTWSRSEPLSR